MKLGGIEGCGASNGGAKGRCGEKTHGYAKRGSRTKTHPAKKAKLSKTAIRKARTRIGARVGAGYRKFGP